MSTRKATTWAAIAAIIVGVLLAMGMAMPVAADVGDPVGPESPLGDVPWAPPQDESFGIWPTDRKLLWDVSLIVDSPTQCTGEDICLLLIVDGGTVEPGTLEWDLDGNGAYNTDCDGSGHCEAAYAASTELRPCWNYPAIQVYFPKAQGYIRLADDSLEYFFAACTLAVTDPPICDLTGPDEFCVGDEGTYDGSGSIRAEKFFWSITPGGAGVDWQITGGGGEFEDSMTVKWLKPGTYYVNLTVWNTCDTDSCGPLTVEVKGVACDITGTTSVCDGAPAETYQGPPGADAYYWWVVPAGSGTISPASADTPTVQVQWNYVGTHRLHVKVTNYYPGEPVDECESECWIDVTVKPLPGCGDITGQDKVCVGDPSTTYYGPADADSWVWCIGSA